jgi:hypothetical protein
MPFNSVAVYFIFLYSYRVKKYSQHFIFKKFKKDI